MVQLSLLADGIHERKIKVPMVIDQDAAVQIVGRTKIEAPANLTFAQGKFESAGERVLVKLVLGSRQPELLSTTIIPGKVMNTGVVYADLVITSLSGTRLASQANIPILWHDVLPSPGAQPGDMVQKHDFLVEGFENVSGYCDCQGKLWLLLAVVVRYCVVVSSERILQIEAAEPFC